MRPRSSRFGRSISSVLAGSSINSWTAPGAGPARFVRMRSSASRSVFHHPGLHYPATLQRLRNGSSSMSFHIKPPKQGGAGFSLPPGAVPARGRTRARLSRAGGELDVAMRIATLLPSATEIVAALGLAGEIVAITHECDFPAEIRDRPRVVRPRVDSRLASAAIDAEVEGALRRGESLYRLDEDALAAARPDLIITQDLCEVCALPSLDVEGIAARLPGPPRVLRLHPHTLDDVFRDIVTVGTAAGRGGEGRRVVAALRARVAA